MLRLWIGPVLLLAACTPATTPSPSPSGHPVSGTFELVGRENFSTNAADQTCAGIGGYDDIAVSLAVRATNESGTIIGLTSLEPGVSQGIKCVFEFAFDPLPDAEFYTFEVGKRGELTYSPAELESLGWSLGFTIGD